MRHILLLLLLCAGTAACPGVEHRGVDGSVPRHDAATRDDSGSLDTARLDTAGSDAAGADGAAVDASGPPPAWTCPQTFWGDDDCDCGCGTQDVDCPGGAAADCDFDFCGQGRHAVDAQNWLCEDDPAVDGGSGDGGTTDAAQPDAALPDATGTDAGTPRGEPCSGYGVADCAPGLVCTPSGTCQEPCAEEHCPNNDNYCFSSSPDYVCDDTTYSYCVEGEGALQLCRSIDLDFTEQFCDGGSGYVHYFHSDQTIPDGCWEGWLEFVGSRICISGVIDSQLTQLGHDLTVITNDPAGYSDDASCGYFSSIELNALEVIGGNLEVGDVSNYADRSAMQVSFEDLELPVLKAVYGQLRYDAAQSVTHINSPQLSLVGGFFVLSDLPAMETVYLPGLEVIEGSLRLDDLPALTTLELSSLRRIDGYVEIMNVPCIDSAALEHLGDLATGPVSIYNSGTGEGCP